MGLSKSNDGILKVDVHAQAVYLTAYEHGVSYNGQALDPGVPIGITQPGSIQSSVGKHALLE